MQHVSARQVTAVLPCLRMRTYQVVLKNVLRLQPRGPVASSSRLRRQMATSAAAGVEQATTQPNVKGSPLQGMEPSVWGQDKLQPRYPRLGAGQEVQGDVVVIGAGLTGLSTAYNLAKAGKKVIVLEDRTVAAGQSGRVAGSAQTWVDDTFTAIKANHSSGTASKVSEAHKAGIDWISSVVSDEGISCDLEKTTGLLYPYDEASQYQEKWDEEVQTCQELGLPQIEQVQLPGTPEVGGLHRALKFSGSIHFNPIALCQGLAEAVIKMGGQIFEVSHVDKFPGDKVEVAGGGTARGDHVVYATHTPIHHDLTVHARQQPFRFYAITLTIPKGKMDSAQEFWTIDPEGSPMFVRVVSQPDSDHDLLLLLDKRQRTGLKADEYQDYWASLEVYAKRRFPLTETVQHKWSGQLYQPVDYLPFIGKDPFNDFQVKTTRWLATGDSGQPEVLGALAGLMLTDGILGRDNKFSDIFSASRVPASLKTGQEVLTGYMKTNVQAILENITPKPGLSGPEDLAPGEGAIMRKGLQPVAAFRDEDGELSVKSAICPHLGCCVQWNPLTKMFDCPCHGSQFTRYGKVVQGPAKADMSTVDW